MSAVSRGFPKAKATETVIKKAVVTLDSNQIELALAEWAVVHYPEYADYEVSIEIDSGYDIPEATITFERQDET